MTEFPKLKQDRVIEEVLVIQWLKLITQEYSSRIAIIHQQEQWTYKELNESSERIAIELKRRSIQPGEIVGLWGQRNFQMVASLIGIVKAGGAFLPIDPDLPKERIDFILEDSRCRFLVRDKDVIQTNRGSSPVLDFNDLAYVLYTSGSTGRPKGVMIGHRSLASFMKGINDSLSLSLWKSIIAVTTVSFDIFILETLIPLSIGLTVILLDENQQRNPLKLKESLQKYRPDIIQMTPSRLQLIEMVDPQFVCLSDISCILVGGEVFPRSLLNKLNTNTNAKIFNLYGPTEATIWATVSDLTMKSEVDIGKPLPHLSLCLVDNEGNLVLEEGEGEVCLSGEGVAYGYLNRHDLNIERFVPLVENPKEKMYKTGDWVKRDSDGALRFLGRIDDQIKIRGYRVELGEIEDVILRHPSIQQVVVAAYTGKYDQLFLCGYYVADSEIDVQELKLGLKEALPSYMIPEYFIQIEEIPKTHNHKVDRKALPNPVSFQSTSNNYKI